MIACLSTHETERQGVTERVRGRRGFPKTRVLGFGMLIGWTFIASILCLCPTFSGTVRVQGAMAGCDVAAANEVLRDTSQLLENFRTPPQRAQHPLIKECTLNYKRIHIMI